MDIVQTIMGWIMLISGATAIMLWMIGGVIAVLQALYMTFVGVRGKQ